MMVMEPKQPTASAFVESLRPRSDHTARSYAQAVGRFLEGMGKPVSRITVADATNYLGSLSGLSAASRAHHISALRSFLKYCPGTGHHPADAPGRSEAAESGPDLDDTLPGGGEEPG